jgi:hypothetical protein
LSGDVQFFILLTPGLNLLEGAVTFKN